MPVHEDVVSHQHECGLWVVVIHLCVVIIAAACSHLMLPVHAVCAHASMGLAQAVAPRWMGWRLAAHMALATDSRSSSSTPSSCERRKVQKLVHIYWALIYRSLSSSKQNMWNECPHGLRTPHSIFISY